MYKILRLALREYYAAVRTKGFIIGLIMLPVFMSGSIIAMALLKDHVDIRERQIVVVDEAGQFSEMLQEAASIRNTQHILTQRIALKYNQYIVLSLSTWTQQILLYNLGNYLTEFAMVKFMLSFTLDLK